MLNRTIRHGLLLFGAMLLVFPFFTGCHSGDENATVATGKPSENSGKATAGKGNMQMQRPNVDKNK